MNTWHQIYLETYCNRNKVMSGFLDNCQLPSCECLRLGERRNAVASISSGILVGFNLMANTRKVWEIGFIQVFIYFILDPIYIRLLEILPTYFGHSASLIGQENEMYCKVMSDRTIFLSENPIDPTVFRNSAIYYVFCYLLFEFTNIYLSISQYYWPSIGVLSVGVRCC